ncbi:chorismate synthase 1, chloroplastic-like [Olea europaea subsp. europaea]|uniref:chorismate synthase n=1 Tax=Olea europaea subsp. europaea TaxID=158383 RepID=A0A8S0UZ40_OLEEU|nr:chorismate synthase 1, chloroplastic-like [Olea europaea subsp. europaea]
MVDCSETAHGYINRFDLLSIGNPPQLQYTNCINHHGLPLDLQSSEMSLAYRPSHADATYDFKYGVKSVQGSGRSATRDIGRVVARAVAKKILNQYSGTEVISLIL